jgi:hypothetical protein
MQYDLMAAAGLTHLTCVDVGLAVELPGHRYADTLPCLEHAPLSPLGPIRAVLPPGRNRVRLDGPGDRGDRPGRNVGRRVGPNTVPDATPGRGHFPWRDFGAGRGIWRLLAVTNGSMGLSENAGRPGEFSNRGPQTGSAVNAHRLFGTQRSPVQIRAARLESPCSWRWRWRW